MIQKPCQFCTTFASRRIQADEDEFGNHRVVGYSCTSHFQWLENQMKDFELQTITVSLTGFHVTGEAVKINDDWEVI